MMMNWSEGGQGCWGRSSTRACFKSLIIKALVLKIPLIPLNKGDFERFGSLLIKEG
jgi:hypothetical protein